MVARHNAAPRLEERHVVGDIFVCGEESRPALAAQRTPPTVVISLPTLCHSQYSRPHREISPRHHEIWEDYEFMLALLTDRWH